jgi:peptide/nickel transport system substrate-binding protein
LCLIILSIVKNRIALIRDSIRKAITSFSLGEKSVFSLLLIIALITAFTTISSVNSLFLTEIPKKGGSLTEGLIGTARYINPTLAFSDTDRDLSSLVYSGLLKAKPDGTFVPDLASDYSISDDGKTYTFNIRENAVFHDGAKVTADDILFTIQKIQDPSLKSPKRANWDGVSVEKISDKTIQFTLKQTYVPFIENTTLGILPKHIWKDAGTDEFAFSQFNIEPIGSGPYKISKVSRNGSGIPESITLESFNHYTLGTPYINSIKLNFYQNEKTLVDAYKKGDFKSFHSISGETAQALEKTGSNIERYPLPQVFAIFFNQNHNPIFTHKEVRLALNIVTDRRAILEEILHGFGTEALSPIPQGLAKSTSINSTTNESSVSNAQAILEKAGWKKNAEGVYELKTKAKTETLAFTISTGDATELKQSAEIIKKQWEALGAKIDINIFEMTDLNQTIIRPRKYDALFFGEVVGRELDLYAFWHSSQRNDPGLNISMYTNTKIDKLLEDSRITNDLNKRTTMYQQIEKEILTDMPAVFMYSPDFIYILATEIKGFSVGKIVLPSDRFADIEKWYIETDHVWSVFR